MACTGNCNQGRNCDCVPDLPVQYAEPEPDQEFGFDWVDFAILGGAMAVVFVVGFGLGRALA